MVLVALHPHELFQIRVEEGPSRAELPSELPFGSHPQVFYVLCVHIRVQRVDKVMLMHDNVMEIYSAVELRKVLVGRPAV